MTYELAHQMAGRINQVLRNRPSIAVVEKDENYFFNWLVVVKNTHQLLIQFEQKKAIETFLDKCKSP